jgi:hypothetical protein
MCVISHNSPIDVVGGPMQIGNCVTDVCAAFFITAHRACIHTHAHATPPLRPLEHSACTHSAQSTNEIRVVVGRTNLHAHC